MEISWWNVVMVVVGLFMVMVIIRLVQDRKRFEEVEAALNDTVSKTQLRQLMVAHMTDLAETEAAALEEKR